MSLKTLGQRQRLNPHSSLIFPGLLFLGFALLPTLLCPASPFSSLLLSCIFQQHTMYLKDFLNLALLWKKSIVLILTLYWEIRELQNVKLDGTSDRWVKL